MKHTILAITLLISLLSSAQTAFDYGKVENNRYTNNFFNIQVTVPGDWVVQSKEQNEFLLESGKKIVSGDDANLKRALEASQVNSAMLLTVFKYELGSSVPYNPSFVLMVENVKMFPGVKTGANYLYGVRKILKSSAMADATIDEEFEKEVIDGVDFYKMNVQRELMGMSIRQTYYSTIKSGFALGFVITFDSEEHEKELKAFLKTFKNLK